MNFGKSLDPVVQGHPSTSGLIQALFNNDLDTVSNGAQCKSICLQRWCSRLLISLSSLDFFIDVQDDARLHVAALLHPGICRERIFAYCKPYTWRVIQDILRKLYPSRSFTPNAPEATLDSSEILPSTRTEALLKEMDRPGFTPLEECIRMNSEDLV